MITYSVSYKTNPADPTQPKKAYGRVQINETMDLHQFSDHIASHNSKYNRGDIYAVLETAVRCMGELVRMGYKISLGDLGAFYPSISCEGAESVADFTADNIRSLSMSWERPAALDNMKAGALFYRVPTRAVRAASLKAENNNKAGDLIEQFDHRGEEDSAVTPDDNLDAGSGEGETSGGGGSNNPDPNA